MIKTPQLLGLLLLALPTAGLGAQCVREVTRYLRFGIPADDWRMAEHVCCHNTRGAEPRGYLEASRHRRAIFKDGVFVLGIMACYIRRHPISRRANRHPRRRMMTIPLKAIQLPHTPAGEPRAHLDDRARAVRPAQRERRDDVLRRRVRRPALRRAARPLVR